MSKLCSIAVLFLLGAVQLTHTLGGPRPRTAGDEFGLEGVPADLVTNLPGLPHANSGGPGIEHYSGYLRASDEHFLHYWFVPSLNDPRTDPLLFWFNGGPGCSSLLGLLKEMGPFLVNPDGRTLRINPNAWTNFASMVYIEAPAGVGFSHGGKNASSLDTNDDQTALENYEAVKQFFLKYPSYRQHDTYITGESYAGVYVPMLAERVVDGLADFPINFKGIAVGNGIMNARLDFNSLYRFSVGHGLITQSQLDSVYEACCGAGTGHADCDLYAAEWAGDCGQKMSDYHFESSGLFVYDIFHVCDPNPQHNSIRMAIDLANMRPNRTQLSPTYFAHLLDKANKRAGSGVMQVDPLACLSDTDMEDYLNRDDVREALHIAPEAGRWHMCGMQGLYSKVHRDMTSQVKKVLKAGVRVLLYYGDTDAACNFMGGEEFSAQLGLEPTGGRSIWRHNGETAGFKQLYSDGQMTFLTILGAGHMAPQWRPMQTNYAIQQFLKNEPI